MRATIAKRMAESMREVPHFYVTVEIDMSEAVRLLLWFNLIGAMFLPFGMAPVGSSPFDWVVGMMIWLGRTVLLAAVLAVVRAVIGRVTLALAAQALGAAALVGLLAAAFLLVQTGVA